MVIFLIGPEISQVSKTAHLKRLRPSLRVEVLRGEVLKKQSCKNIWFRSFHHDVFKLGVFLL